MFKANEELIGRAWVRDDVRCGYRTGQFSPIGADYRFVSDKALCALRHTAYGQELMSIVTGQAH